MSKEHKAVLTMLAIARTAYEQTEAGKARLKYLDLRVTNLWNDDTLRRDELAYIGLELYRRAQEE